MVIDVSIGDRVKNDLLGPGEIMIKYPYDEVVMVKFDKTPPWEYNCHGNPTIMFKKDLTKEEE